MITSRQVGRTDNHKATDIAVSRYIADFRQTPWTQKAFAFQLRVANTQTRRRSIRQSRRKSHHHKVGRGVHSSRPRCAGKCVLCGGRHKFKQKVLEVTFVHRNAELTYLDMDKAVSCNTKTRLTHRQFYHTALCRSSSRQLTLQRIFVSCFLYNRPVCRGCCRDRRSLASRI